MRRFFQSLKAALRFRDYHPQPVSVASATRWMKQLQKKDLKLACKLLDEVIYFSEGETKKLLLHHNRVLMSNLSKAGLPAKKLIYLQTDDAGSSSPMMLGMLRNAAGLEQLGCNLLDGRDALGILETTKRLEEGAIIYVDDFVGSGTQLEKARTFVMQNVVGSFSEFLIVPSIWEEGYARLSHLGITVHTGHIHAKAERPLHENSHLMHAESRDRLIEICKTIRKGSGLGYENMATMVVLYRNAPNSIPAILRGSDRQDPFYGLFPRFKDLPVQKPK